MAYRRGIRVDTYLSSSAGCFQKVEALITAEVVTVAFVMLECPLVSVAHERGVVRVARFQRRSLDEKRRYALVLSAQATIL